MEDRDNERFLALVTKGAGALQAGKIAEAKDAFEDAINIRPDHPQANNMHALCMFRLGHYEEAEAAFRRLIQNSPTEPSLRLNLSMVHLKCGELSNAQRELERVLELSPGHTRAMSYMGLVHERIGNFSEAALWYREAKNDKRAQQMDIAAKALKQDSKANDIDATEAETQPNVVPAPQQEALSENAVMPLATAAPPADLSEIPKPGDASFAEIATGTFERPSLPDLLRANPQIVPAPPPLDTELTSETVDNPLPTIEVPVRRLDELSQVAFGDLPLGEEEAKDVITFAVDEVAYLRTDRLVGLGGQFEVEPLNRRYRGRRTDSLFGGNDAPMIAALGKGVAWLDGEDHRVTTLSLEEEEFYLLERMLFAFSAGLVWENGRLPADVGRELDLDIVHLRGSGRTLIGTQRPLFGLKVTRDQPITLLTERLVGWNGQVVPYRGPFPGLPEHAKRPQIVRFEGEGTVLAM